MSHEDEELSIAVHYDRNPLKVAARARTRRRRTMNSRESDRVPERNITTKRCPAKGRARL